MNRAKHGQNDGVVAAKLSCPLGHGAGFCLAARDVFDEIVDRALTMAPTGERQRQRIVRINRQCFIEKIERFGRLVFLECPNMWHRLHSVVVGAEVLWTLSPRPLDLGNAD